VAEKKAASILEFLAADSVLFLDDIEKEAALALLAETVCKAAGQDCTRIRAGILEREKMLSTGLGLGIAIPHVRLREIEQFSVAVAISQKGIEYAALDGEPVHIIFMIIGPGKSHDRYVRFMAHVTMVLRNCECRRAMIKAGNAEQVRTILAQYEKQA
jgi:nitrogen PTS system EIIA component